MKAAAHYNCKLYILFKLLRHLIQFKAPLDHSWSNPAVKIMITTTPLIIKIVLSGEVISTLKGNNRAISMSKIRKINVTTKNRIEKDLRAFLKGENPHSKGVIFYRSCSDFSLNLKVSKTIANEIIIITVYMVNIIIIINYLISK